MEVDLKKVPTGMSQPIGPIADAANALMGSFQHRVSDFLAIDFKYDKDNRAFLFNIFPRVPDKTGFHPNNQSFAQMVEGCVAQVLGHNIAVEAEFHEENGLDDEGRKADTRVIANYRNQDGSLARTTFSKKVPMVWVRITKVPMADPNLILNRVTESIIEASNRLVA